MKVYGKLERGSRENGSALLIAIFALMLISVVGLALVVSTGTDTALAGNYRNSTGAYYAAVAGLEEARGRLLLRNPDYINKTGAYAGLFSAQGLPSLGVTDVLYIINPVGGETVDPTDSESPYADTEYAAEMGWPLSGANVHAYISSVSPVAGLPGPGFKWVRINPVTEKGLGIDVNNSGGTPNSFTPLRYGGNGLTLNPTGNQALGITAFVVMPDKSTRLLQYVTVPNIIQTIPSAPSGLNFDFPAALTLAGNVVSFTGPSSGNDFRITGQDQTPVCSSPDYMVASIGYTNSADSGIATGAIPATDYVGSPPPNGSTPSQAPASIQNVSPAMNPNWLNPGWLEPNVVQNITTNADVLLNGNATGNDILAKAPTMSAINPMTIVVNGNLDLNSFYGQGFGLLLVTGTLYYSPSATWNGVVLVIGQGAMTVSLTSDPGEINGAVFVAKTRDASNAVLPALGASSFTVSGPGSATGIKYNSCWIHGSGTVAGAQGPLNFRIVSFREITQ